VIPPKKIPDPQDKKPADWDDRAVIEDKDAKKPEDWDENQPKEVLDEEAVKPSDWLEEEEPLIADETAAKPEDWDDEMDGEYEPRKVPNPKCEGRSGCGKWKRPMKANPLYKVGIIIQTTLDSNDNLRANGLHRRSRIQTTRVCGRLSSLRIRIISRPSH
jgi:hypothetical protein